jgi:putative Holliday junction resolvase
MRSGRRVAFDIGKARIGVAVSDPHGILASPRDHITRSADQQETINKILKLLSAEEVIEAYFGLPNNLKNLETDSTIDAINIAVLVANATQISIRLVDERFSTKIASGAMSSIGKNTRQQRKSIDSAAAVVILETALQYEKTTGLVPGIAAEEYRNGE